VFTSDLFDIGSRAIAAAIVSNNDFSRIGGVAKVGEDLTQALWKPPLFIIGRHDN
jgi:hypothetical protein